MDSVSLAESGSGPQKIRTMHHPEGIDPDQIFFHEAEIRDLILAYQREPSAEIWQKIVIGCLPLIDSLIRKHNFQFYGDQDALRGECIIKLFKVIQHFNPVRGRAFSCLTVAITRFLISYVQAIRIRSKRMILVKDKELEQYRANGETGVQLPAELKAKVRTIQTRFNREPDRAAIKLLINYFLLEGFSQPRKLVLETVRRQFDLTLEKAGALYDYALVSLRSVLHEYYTPVYSTQDMLRLCHRLTVLPEFCSIVGEKCFARVMDVFAGLTLSFPSKSALEKMRKSQEFLNRLSDDKAAFLPSPLGPSSEDQLLSAVIEGHHTDEPLY
jgi:hypothetical protein